MGGVFFILNDEMESRPYKKSVADNPGRRWASCGQFEESSKALSLGQLRKLEICWTDRPILTTKGHLDVDGRATS